MKANFILRKRTLVIVLIMILSGAGVSLAAPGIVANLSSGVGYDPLSATEQQRALSAALGEASNLVNSSANRADVRSEILLVERHQETKDAYRQGVWPRRADIYVYNYDSDTLEQRLVNLDNNHVDSLEVLKNVQLPPTANEIQWSTELAFAQPQFHADLALWYKNLKGEDLTSFDQLAAKAFIFHASAMGTANLGNAADCGVKRCVQLMIYTKDMIAFEQSPVIDLSAQQLATIMKPG